MKFLGKKIGWSLMIIGLFIVGMAFYWKTLGGFGRYGGMIFGAGFMIVIRRHKSVFNWE
jgi:hypothetical protein